MPVSLYSYARIIFNVAGTDSVCIPTYWRDDVLRVDVVVCFKESSLAVMNWEAHDRNYHTEFRGSR